MECAQTFRASTRTTCQGAVRREGFTIWIYKVDQDSLFRILTNLSTMSSAVLQSVDIEKKAGAGVVDVEIPSRSSVTTLPGSEELAKEKQVEELKEEVLEPPTLPQKKGNSSATRWLDCKFWQIVVVDP